MSLIMFGARILKPNDDDMMRLTRGHSTCNRGMTVLNQQSLPAIDGEEDVVRRVSEVLIDAIILLIPWTVLTTVSAVEPRMEFIDNSVGISQVVDMNVHGQIVGKREVRIPSIGLGQETFCYNGQDTAKIKVLEGYTNLEPYSISGNGIVVGYVSRVLGHPQGSLRAFAWDSSSDEIIGLEKPASNGGCHAFDISSDGSTITGYCTSANPPQMGPCVWNKANGVWRYQSLSTIHDYNPYLLTSRVVCSDDGRQIAACLVEDVITGAFPVYKNAVFIWTRGEDGPWKRTKVHDGPLTLAGINNNRLIAGTLVAKGHRRAFVLDRSHKFYVLDLLDGDESAQALGLNNHGVVVGLSDDPHGPVGGPQAFIWSDGCLSALELAGDIEYSAATAINDRGQIAGYLKPSIAEEEDGPSKWVSFILDGATRP